MGLYNSLKVGLNKSLKVDLHNSLKVGFLNSIKVGLHNSLKVCFLNSIKVDLHNSLKVGLHKSLNMGLLTFISKADIPSVADSRGGALGASAPTSPRQKVNHIY